MNGSEPMLWILDLGLKSVCVGLLALSVAVSLRRSSARLRYTLWATTCLSLVALPVLTLALPSWGVPLWPAVRQHITRSVPSPGLLIGDAPVLRSTQLSPAALPFDPLELDSGLSKPAPGTPGATAGRSWNWNTSDGLLLLSTVWVVGLALGMLYFVLGLARLRRLEHMAGACRDPQWLTLLALLSRRLALVRPVRLLFSPEAQTPMSWGWRHAVVLLPAAAQDWSPRRREIVLLHELTHIQRRDWPIQIAARMATVFYWFNPLAWTVARRLADEREHACDEAVIAGGTRPSEYAHHLLELSMSLRAARALRYPALTMAQSSHLEDRLMSILSRSNRDHSTLTQRVWAVAGVALLAGILATVDPWSARAQQAAYSNADGDTELSFSNGVSSELHFSGDGVNVARSMGFSSGVGISNNAGAGRGMTLGFSSGSGASVSQGTGVAAGRVAIASGDGSVYVWEAGDGGDGKDGSSYAWSSNSNGRSSRMSSSGGDYMFSWAQDGFRFEFRVHGDTTLEEDACVIESLGDEAYVIMQTEIDAVTKRLRITSDGEGGMREDWFVDGVKQPLDRDARAWREAFENVCSDYRAMGAIRGQVGSLRGEIGSIRGEVGSLRGQIGGIRGEAGSLRGQIGSIRGEVGHLRGQIGNLRGQRGSLRGQIGSLRGHIAGLKQQGRRLEREDEPSEGERAAIESAIEQASEEIAKIEQHIEELATERRVAEIEASIEALQSGDRIAAIQEQLEALETGERIEAVQAQIEAVRAGERIAEIQSRIENLDAEARIEDIEARMAPEFARLKALAGD